MKPLSNIQIWLAQTRANFLLLAILLVAIGAALAFNYQEFSARPWAWLDFVLIALGVVSAHISVNLFNEYSDYHTQIDFHTPRNPFSGGSGMLTNAHTSHKSVLRLAIITLSIALVIGTYFVLVSHWFLMLLILIGAFSILFYTEFLARNLLGEIFAGLSLGTFVVMGTFIAMTASWDILIWDILPAEVLLISIPPGILTALLLLLNEFPDAEADKSGGRNHLVIRFGKKGASIIYIAGLILTFTLIIGIAVSGIGSNWLLIALLPLPLAMSAAYTAFRFGDKNEKIIPALGKNVMLVLGTDLLLTIALIIQT